MSKALYIDVCTLSRPFDEQHFLRIRLETEAFNLILSKVKQRDYTMLVSPVHIKEIDAISDSFERIELQTLLEEYGKPVRADKTAARKRAEELVKAGFGIADAAHVAFAEQAGAQFVSCDDALVKKCNRHGVKVWCGNPVAFCEKEELK